MNEWKPTHYETRDERGDVRIRAMSNGQFEVLDRNATFSSLVVDTFDIAKEVAGDMLSALGDLRALQKQMDLIHKDWRVKAGRDWVAV